MESYTRKCKGYATIHTLKTISISISVSVALIICFTIIHLHHNTNPSSVSEPNRFDSSFQSSNPIIHTVSYIFMVSLAKATEQLQDAIPLILSNTDSGVAWRNCSGSVLNGWGEIQDAAEHAIMKRLGDDQRAEMASQICTAEGFIESCLDDLKKVESTAADQVRDKLLLAMVHLRGRGDFLISDYEQVWNRVIGAGWGAILESFFYLIIFGLQLFFLLCILQKISEFRSN